jgi:hypothetical protein
MAPNVIGYRLDLGAAITLRGMADDVTGGSNDQGIGEILTGHLFDHGDRFPGPVAAPAYVEDSIHPTLSPNGCRAGLAAGPEPREDAEFPPTSFGSS